MENEKRVVAVFTGNRAEYGLLKPILRSIDSDFRVDLKLVVSGAHFDQDFGGTLDEIVKDGFHISAEARIPSFPQDKKFTALSIAKTIEVLAPILEKLKPDLFVVYADRFEGLAAAITATQMNIPTAHVEGGDVTEGGALDDSVRHAITKLSHLHFTTNEDSERRILSMGEQSWRVFNVGFPAVDLILSGDFASPEEIVNALPLDLERPIVLLTQHSVTIESEKASLQFIPTVEAVKALCEKNIQVILTYPNNDNGASAIIEEIRRLEDTFTNPNLIIRKSLGRYLYHGVLGLSLNQNAKVICVGNSSSGIKETPAFKVPAINIGTRQQGRLRGDNVTDVGYNTTEILSAIENALFNSSYRELVWSTRNPYYQGGASKKILEVLKTITLDENLLRKEITI